VFYALSILYNWTLENKEEIQSGRFLIPWCEQRNLVIMLLRDPCNEHIINLRNKKTREIKQD
jgi:hypothetical protein